MASANGCCCPDRIASLTSTLTCFTNTHAETLREAEGGLRKIAHENIFLPTHRGRRCCFVWAKIFHHVNLHKILQTGFVLRPKLTCLQNLLDLVRNWLAHRNSQHTFPEFSYLFEAKVAKIKLRFSSIDNPQSISKLIFVSWVSAKFPAFALRNFPAIFRTLTFNLPQNS